MELFGDGDEVGPLPGLRLITTFPAGPRRDKALGVSGALLSLGFVVETIGGGVITSGLSWRWTMLILVIMGAVILTGSLTLLDKTRERGASIRLDVPGAVLATVGLVALVYGISTGSSAGWVSIPTLAALITAVILLAAFGLVEPATRRHSHRCPSSTARRSNGAV